MFFRRQTMEGLAQTDKECFINQMMVEAIWLSDI